MAKAKAKTTATTPAKPTALAACKRVWQLKLGSSSAYRTFVSGDHVVFWTGSQVRTIEIANGRSPAKAKADEGAPWLDGDALWVPTKNGFEVRVAGTLALTRTIETPRPKGMTFSRNFARVHGTRAYRLARSNEVTKVGDELRNAYFLAAYDLDGKQLYLAPITTSSTNTIQGVCARDQFAIAFRTTKAYDVFHGATADGRVAGSTSRDSHLDLVDDHLVETRGKLQVLRGGAWQPLDCTGATRRIGEHLYCIGHRELVRLDDQLRVVARVPIATPASPDDAHRVVPTSVCRVGASLFVVERTRALDTGTPPPRTPYRYLHRDALTLAEVGGAGTLEEASGLQLHGKVGDIYVAKVLGDFVGLQIAV